ncbi:JmjC domain-containing protein [Pseudomonas sessilinigenes]|uniref:Cupin domain-containing protein n=1 Tax=Pseudomonas sessilinigenes TaxID=658629 RepID=A0ABX8MXV4_9PSED|nr:cupin domain-containing protein [Pseudomonas sessilinigenes]AZC24394.1 hypothetical protein C4K39_2720 [Pseudomonas sessilinigenes]QXH43335.1 cupin domain-containing protein [Pseudomonas sessilinigenes]
MGEKLLLSSPMQTTIISKLLGCTVQKFLEDIWATNQCFNLSGAVDYLEVLPSLSSLDSLYFSLESAGARLGVVDGHASPSSGTSLVRSDGRVALDEVHAAYRSGKTLLLTHLQNSHIGVARLARFIESELHGAGILLRKEVGANLFLTPPFSRGFEPHYDGHDVLILQLAGKKIWNTFDQRPKIRAGMEGDQVPPDQLGQIRNTFELHQGDVLYLPRGKPHVAYTTNENSLHLTLSIVPATWSDFFAEEIKSRSDIDSRLTETSQPPILGISPSNASELRQRLGRRWLANLHSLPEVPPWTLSINHPNISVRLAKSVIAELEILPLSDTINVRLPGSTIRLGADAAETVKRILEGHVISPKNISLGGRTDDSKTRFLHQLIEIGLATPVLE